MGGGRGGVNGERDKASVPTDAQSILDALLGPTGVLAGLVFFIWAAAKDKPLIVFGWVYRDMEADRNRWRDAATRSTTLAHSGADLAREAVDVVKRQR